MAKVKFGGRQKLAVKTLRIFIAVKVSKSESKEEVIIHCKRTSALVTVTANRVAVGNRLLVLFMGEIIDLLALLHRNPKIF